MHIPLCHHTKMDGQRCRAIAMSADTLCYFHKRTQNRFRTPRRGRVARATPITLAPITDRESILTALSQVIVALAAGQLNASQAKTIFQGINLAADRL